ncbi:MAG: hypothetical protein P8Q27_01400, partial [Flavicella sp.]|nr:hypothetical protein [Flavicella sp.]
LFPPSKIANRIHQKFLEQSRTIARFQKRLQLSALIATNERCALKYYYSKSPIKLRGMRTAKDRRALNTKTNLAKNQQSEV